MWKKTLRYIYLGYIILDEKKKKVDNNNYTDVTTLLQKNKIMFVTFEKN